MGLFGNTARKKGGRAEKEMGKFGSFGRGEWDEPGNLRAAKKGLSVGELGKMPEEVCGQAF